MAKKTKLVGILNITPDSFSDGGGGDSVIALKRLELMLEYGPEIIDIGAASTRPNSSIILAEEEIARFDRVLSAIVPVIKNSSIKISIDSYNFETTRYLLNKFPLAWINDQSGFIDKRMINLAIDSGLKLVIMHHFTIPTNPANIIPIELDVVSVVKDWLSKKIYYLVNMGVSKSQIIIDPGIGFAKNAIQSWQLINRAKELLDLGYPIMYGHSRKSFLNTVTDLDFAKRDLETSVISLYLANCGVDYLRVHDLESNSRALKLREFL